MDKITAQDLVVAGAIFAVWMVVSEIVTLKRRVRKLEQRVFGRAEPAP